MHALSALHGLAGAATGLTLLALGITVFGATVVWQLRRDRLTLQAAERFEAVPISPVVKRHVPGHLQSNISSEEFAVIRQSIARKFPRWITATTLSGLVTLSAGTVSWILIDKNRQLIAAAQLAEQSPNPVDALKAITGVWGWKHEILQSCSQNPHTISVTEGNKGLSVRFAKPLWDGSQEVSNLEYEIVGVEPSKLVLASMSPQRTDTRNQPRWYFIFSDSDTYRIGRSGRFGTTGDIVRCN
jgi:hypothetical protein